MTVDPSTLETTTLSTQPEPPRLPSLTVRGWLRWAWRQLTSMRTALVLLFLLALAAVPGSVFPQRGSSTGDVGSYLAQHPRLGPVLDRLGMFDVFGSPWFSAIYILLFVSLTGCVVPRSFQHARALRSRPPAAPRNLDRLPEHRSFVADGDADHGGRGGRAVAAARTLAGRRRPRRGHGQRREGLPARDREPGLPHRAGRAAGRRRARGAVRHARHGDRRRGHQLRQHACRGTTASAQAGWRVRARCRRSRSRWTPSPRRTSAAGRRTPRRARSPRSSPCATLRVPQRTRSTVKVNEPLSVDGTKAFLIGHGYAPHVTVRDGQGRVVLSSAVPFLPRDNHFLSEGVIKVPDARPTQIGFRALFLPTARIDPVLGGQSHVPGAGQPRAAAHALQGRPRPGHRHAAVGVPARHLADDPGRR